MDKTNGGKQQIGRECSQDIARSVVASRAQDEKETQPNTHLNKPAPSEFDHPHQRDQSQANGLPHVGPRSAPGMRTGPHAKSPVRPNPSGTAIRTPCTTRKFWQPRASAPRQVNDSTTLRETPARRRPSHRKTTVTAFAASAATSKDRRQSRRPVVSNRNFADHATSRRSSDWSYGRIRRHIARTAHSTARMSCFSSARATSSRSGQLPGAVAHRHRLRCHHEEPTAGHGHHRIPHQARGCERHLQPPEPLPRRQMKADRGLIQVGRHRFERLVQY